MFVVYSVMSGLLPLTCSQGTKSERVLENGSPLRNHQSITTSHAVFNTEGQLSGSSSLVCFVNGGRRALSYGYMASVCILPSSSFHSWCPSLRLAGSGKSILWSVFTQHSTLRLTHAF